MSGTYNNLAYKTTSTAKPTNVQDNSILVEKDTGRRYWRTPAVPYTDEDITWDSSTAVNVSISGNTATATGTSAWDKIVRSTQTWTPSDEPTLEFTIAAGNGVLNQMNGFGEGTLGSSYQSLDYALYTESTLGVYESGAQKFTDSSVTPSSSDTFKVTMDSNGLVEYWRNGSVFYTSLQTASGTYYAQFTPKTLDESVTVTLTQTSSGSSETAGTIGNALQDPNLTYSDSNLPDNTDALSVGGFVKLDETAPTLQDDFSGTDNWTAINSGVGVNVASDLIDWESDGVVPHASTYIAQSISDSSFILDFDITFDTVTSGSDTDGLYIAVLLDAENTYLSDGYFLRDALGVAFELDNSPSSTTNIQAFACDNLNIYDCFELNTPTGAVSTFAETGAAGETMNVRMVRDAGSFEVCVYPTASRTTATECETVDANDGGTVNGLQNIHVATTFDNTNDHTFDGTVDNIVLYDGITSIPAPTGKLLGLNDVTFNVGATTASVDETVTTTISYSTSLIYQESTGCMVQYQSMMTATQAEQKREL